MSRQFNLGLYLILGGLIVISLIFFGSQDVEAEDQGDHAADEAAIRQRSKNYTEAVSRRDAEELASYWTPDAVYINPTKGLYVQGHDEIVEEYKRWFNDKVDKVEVTTKEISFPGPGEAAETGFIRITFKDNRPPIEHAFGALLVKDGDKWLFKEVRQIPLKAAPTHFDELKALSWLVGNWIDKDKDVVIQRNVKWDKYKNFLIQDFNMQLYGQDIIDGKELIAWDPIEKRIRSWVFDSDGGFGEGKWYKQGDSWYVRTVYTLADGKKATAVNIFTKLDDNSYTWASVGRDVNGDILPNIEPTKVERVTSNIEQ